MEHFSLGGGEISLLKGSACPSDNGMKVKTLERTSNIYLFHLRKGEEYLVEALHAFRQMPALTQSSVNETASWNRCSQAQL